jgi:hypothetical protein
VPHPIPVSKSPTPCRLSTLIPTLTGTNPAFSIPSSTPKGRIGSPTRPAASSTPFWTLPAPAGCPFPQTNASLGGAAEVDKKPKFYRILEEIKRQHPYCGKTGTQQEVARLQSFAKAPTYFGVANWQAEDILPYLDQRTPKLCQPRTLFRGSGFLNPRERSSIQIQGFKARWRYFPLSSASGSVRQLNLRGGHSIKTCETKPACWMAKAPA